MGAREEIADVIAKWAARTHVSGKSGKELLQPTLAIALREAGYTVDVEDQGIFLRAGMPVWRSKDDSTIEATRGRRRVDLVVYSGSAAVALIETESDLHDLRSVGVTRRRGHYDVWSIAKTAGGEYFHSNKSLERMAAAAFYWHMFHSTGRYPSPDEAVQLLESIHSDDALQHNPGGLRLFLISGICRAGDRPILEPRLQSLGAQLACVKFT
jgi:hypothetical protein